MWHSSDFYLGLRQGTNILNAGETPSLEIVALRADGKPWPETVKAHLTVQRVDWLTVRVQGAGKAVRFRNEQVFTNVLEKEISVAPVPAPEASQKEGKGGEKNSDGGALPRRRHVESQDDAKGNLLTDLPPLPAGEYLMEVTAEDAGGRPVVSSLDFQVTGADGSGAELSRRRPT